MRINTKLLPCTLLIALITSGCGRPGDKGTIRPPLPIAQRAIAPDGSAIKAPVYQVYADSKLTFRAPPTWSIKRLPSKDANLHMIEINHDSGFFGRITLIKKSNAPGTFPKEILKSLKEGNQTLTSEVYARRLGKENASGFLYTYQFEKKKWIGRVVSVTHQQSELCFLGQYPEALRASLKTKVDRVMRSVQLQTKSSKKGHTVSVQP